jgi:cobalt-zinc-cadmium resistance protein CzcA
LAGALVLAVTVSPVLCVLLLRHIRPTADNFLVRGLQALYLAQLRWLLRFRWLVLAGYLSVVTVTGFVAANMGREFMPELEEGCLFIRGTFPMNVSFEEMATQAVKFRRVLHELPEIQVISNTVGRPDDGFDTGGYFNLESNIPLRPQAEWLVDPKRGRPRTKAELVADLQQSLEREFPGVDWDISQIIRDNVMEYLSGVKGDNSIKIFGPDLDTLEKIAARARDALNTVPGIENAGVFRILGQANLELPVDRQKCARWNVSAADVQGVIQSAVGGKSATQMIEGEKSYDVVVRWPDRLRDDEQAILEIPVPVGNSVIDGAQVTLASTPTSGGAEGISASGTTLTLPAPTGNMFNAAAFAMATPTRRLADLVTPLDAKGQTDPSGSFLRPGASTIYRDQGQRFIAVKFEVRDRDLASAVSEARAKVDPLITAPYRAEWSGEFQQMEQAERRMARMFAVSISVIGLILFLAFRSILDAVVVFANVVAMAIGGVWAIKLAGLNFNVSAAVGFISVLGVAVMNGLLFVSALNRLRAEGMDLANALVDATRHLVRPIVMTALAAMLGLLPAAISTRMGSESQKPLAVVVVGGMLSTIVCLNLVPLLYSLYGHREPPEAAGTGPQH